MSAAEWVTYGGCGAALFLAFIAALCVIAKAMR